MLTLLLLRFHRTEQDTELRRQNAIIEVFVSAERKNPNVPGGVKLAPVKPPSREHTPAAEPELQWDEFLTGLDEFDQGARQESSFPVEESSFPVEEC